jgi:H+/Cl- antiporter ClcA
VTLLVTKFAPEARGHGVPEVMADSILDWSQRFGCWSWQRRLIIRHFSVRFCFFAVLGVLVGLASTAFIGGLHRTEMIFERIRNPYIRHATGILAVGILIYGLFQRFGHYFVEGVGYATVQDVLLGWSRDCASSWIALCL